MTTTPATLHFDCARNPCHEILTLACEWIEREMWLSDDLDDITHEDARDIIPNYYPRGWEGFVRDHDTPWPV